MNIDDALVALCRTHNLTALSCHVSMEVVLPENRFTAYVHWALDGVRQCHDGHGASVSEAIAHAIQQVNDTRARAVDVPAMKLDVAA